MTTEQKILMTTEQKFLMTTEQKKSQWLLNEKLSNKSEAKKNLSNL